MKRIISIILMLVGFVSITTPHNLLNSSEEDVVKCNMFNVKVNIYNLKTLDFSKENLVKYLELNKVENLKKIMSQAILETAWFNSDSFKTGNNLFGMKLAKCRRSTATGTHLGHASYDHWTDSVDDYLLWMDYWKSRGYSYNCHYKFLDSIGYATDPYYNNKLKFIEKKEFNVEVS